MNFYKHHIGDYAAATAHLSIVEDGAYSRLLRIYYRDEKPLPGDMKTVLRLTAARSREEREAVQTVLEEFFTFDPVANVWRNKRADEELAKWAQQAETNRRIAEEREARKRARAANDTGTNRATAGNDSFNETSDASSSSREPSQKPEARSQKEAKAVSSHAIEPHPPEPDAARAPDATRIGLACRAIVRGGVPRTNSADSRLLDALAAGVTDAELEATAREAATYHPPKGFAWVVVTAHGRRTERRVDSGHVPQSRTRATLATLQAAKLPEPAP